MRFLFRLDLSLHAGAGKKIRILIFRTKHGVSSGFHFFSAEVHGPAIAFD